MTQQEQSSSQSDEPLKVARSAIDHASAMDEWVKQMPEPNPQTAERTFSEALGEIIGELKRIQVCGNLKGAKDKINEMVNDGTAHGAKAQEAMEQIDEAARLNNCPGTWY